MCIRDSRQLISASHDKLVKIWDLNTLRCRHTLKGHNSRVRALAMSGKLLFSGSNDRSIKVWNLELVSQTQSLDSHTSWIRALATEKDVRAQPEPKALPPCLPPCRGPAAASAWPLATGRPRAPPTLGPRAPPS